MKSEKILKLIYFQLTMLNAGNCGIISYFKTKDSKYLDEALKDIELIGKEAIEEAQKDNS